MLENPIVIEKNNIIAITYGIGCARPILIVTMLSVVSVMVVTGTANMIVLIASAWPQLSELDKRSISGKYEIIGEICTNADKKGF